MFAWVCTLFRLYKDIEHSEKLLPNKQVFILHGYLLSGYLLLYIIINVVVSVAYNMENKNTQLILFAIYDISLSIQNLLQAITFFLVVKLMLPITPSDKNKRSKFQRFLFKGFAD